MRATDQHLLPRAYESLLQQGVDWQWVIEVDGASAQVWDPQDERIRISASQRALGVAAARNLALVAVRTPFVVVLDADDALPDGALDLMRNMMLDSGCFALSGGLRVVDDLDGASHLRLPKVVPGVYSPGSLPGLALQLQTLPTPTQAAIYRTDALRAVGGWPGMVLCQDVAAFMLVAQRWPVLILHDIIYEYHRRLGQSTAAAELAQHDLMLRSRTLLAQQMQAHRELQTSVAPVVPVHWPTY